MITSKFINASLGMAASLFAATELNATVVDLTGSTNSGSVSGAQFVFANQQPAAGLSNPFLRLSSTGTEQGYNTSGGTPFDTDAGSFTKNIRVSDLEASRFTLNGTAYYSLLLQANEPTGSSSLLTLQRLEFYTSTQGSKNTTDVASLGTMRWSLDSGSDSMVKIDANRPHGTGTGDMYAYIPAANFNNANKNDFVYMFVGFGDANDSGNGFEEWAIVNAITPVPELSTFFPIIGLMVAVGSTHILRRRRMARMKA